MTSRIWSIFSLFLALIKVILKRSNNVSINKNFLNNKLRG